MAVQLEQGAERAEVKRRLFTLDEYERLCAAGVFDEDERIELIHGEILEMPPIGPEHMSSAARLHREFSLHLGRSALVWPQGNSIRLPESNSSPEPDITIVRWRDDYYRHQAPGPDDVILIVEISKSTLAYDKNLKATLYAKAGIQEYWLVNLIENVVEVYGEPNEGKYQSVRTAGKGETVPLPGGLKGSVAVDEIIGS